MAIEQITVQLSLFEKIKILRDQLEECKREITATESTIRSLLLQIETQRFLESLSSYYTMLSTVIPSPEEIKKLEEKRDLLHTLVDTIQCKIPALLAVADGGGTGITPTTGQTIIEQNTPISAPPRKAKFDF